MTLDWKEELGRKDVYHLRVSNIPVIKIYICKPRQWNICYMNGSCLYEKVTSKKKAMEISEAYIRDWMLELTYAIMKEKLYI